MSHAPDSAVSGPLTYVIGVAAATISQVTLNDLVILFSLILVLIRIYIECSDFSARRAERKRKAQQEITKRLFTKSADE